MFQQRPWLLFSVACISFLSLQSGAVAQVPPPLRNTIDTVPAGWMGPVFELSKDYPTTVPADPKPWKAFSFKTQPREYITALLNYALEGNAAVDWKVQDNAVRKWYHAPGLLSAQGSRKSGREFVRGLTRERPSRPNELHANQTQSVSNWAVGFYNPIGAFTIGKVWENPDSPNIDAAKFEDGAVAFKLLFTTASETEVPFLANSLKWQAHVDLLNISPASTARRQADVLLLQVDVAVRDDDANETTGWVFGTFMYQNDAPGSTPFERLVPVGLMWGNDPDLTKAKFDAGERATQTWLNTDGMPPTKSPHFGWLDRLNGPVDNPLSSCLSCHGRAVIPYDSTKIAPGSAATADNPAKKFFTNTKAAEVYEGAPAGSKSLDYSLQLGVGIRTFPGTHAPVFADIALSKQFNDRGGEPDEEVGDAPANPAVEQPAQPAGAPVAAPAADRGYLIWIGLAVLLIVIAVIAFRASR